MSADIPSEVAEDYSFLKRSLLEVEAYKNAREHTKAIRTAIMLFQYIEMHPRMFTYNPRLATVIQSKIVEIKINGKRDEHDINDWDNLMAVCNRVRELAQ